MFCSICGTQKQLKQGKWVCPRCTDPDFAEKHMATCQEETSKRNLDAILDTVQKIRDGKEIFHSEYVLLESVQDSDQQLTVYGANIKSHFNALKKQYVRFNCSRGINSCYIPKGQSRLKSFIMLSLDDIICEHKVEMFTHLRCCSVSNEKCFFYKSVTL